MKINGLKKLKRDPSNGNIILTPRNFSINHIQAGIYLAAYAWIDIKNLDKLCLIKNFSYNCGTNAMKKIIDKNGKKGVDIVKYNSIIVPYIGTEIFNIETAKYLYVKFPKSKQYIPFNYNIEYLLTIDEKMRGEEIWEGYNIISSTYDSEDTLTFSKRLDTITEFLELRRIPKNKINEVINEFIKQEIFKKIVEYIDNHNGNWSIGIKDRNPRIFSAYDFDFCSGIKGNFTHETFSDNGKTDLKSLIDQYKDLPWLKTYIENVIVNFNMENVFEESYDTTGISIPQDIKQYFSDFYKNKKKELQQIYQEVLSDKIKGDDDLCI